MIINHRGNHGSMYRKLTGWLAVAVLATQVLAAAAWHPPAGAGLWADLALVCSTDAGGAPQVPAADHRLCVFCLPLMGGGVAAPDEVATPLPPPAPVTRPNRPQAVSAVPAPRRSNTARGPPSV